MDQGLNDMSISCEIFVNIQGHQVLGIGHLREDLVMDQGLNVMLDVGM